MAVVRTLLKACIDLADAFEESSHQLVLEKLNHLEGMGRTASTIAEHGQGTASSMVTKQSSGIQQALPSPSHQVLPTTLDVIISTDNTITLSALRCNADQNNNNKLYAPVIYINNVIKECRSNQKIEIIEIRAARLFKSRDLDIYTQSHQNYLTLIKYLRDRLLIILIKVASTFFEIIVHNFSTKIVNLMY